VNEAIREMFLTDWVKEAATNEIVEKLIELDERGKEIERLNKENNDLRRLYQRTYKHLFEKGNDELARYFQAQIDECPTFYVEPIVDYYKEAKRLNNIIKEVREYIEDKFAVILADDLFLDHDEGIERKRIQQILEILDKTGSDK